MSAENNPEYIKWLWALPAMLLGWLHMRQGKVEDIANAVSARLTENYMTTEKVEKTIEKARQDLKDDMQPIHKRLESIETDIKYLVRLKIEENSKSH